MIHRIRNRVSALCEFTVYCIVVLPRAVRSTDSS